MEYFTLLHLEKEPFSNSPDPDFFYASAQHMECLQKVELTIRLRQGMSVVLGEVGTGKTTLCRQLIRKLNLDDGLVDTHLILDPAFVSEREFLLTLCATLAMPEPGDDDGERQIKEEIKTHLFERAVEQERIVCLLIDEGQKLPDYCLEGLRELLNYETNNAKLLQIVIFAQEEFRERMAAHANFTDRIATLYTLEPLGFAETKKMIRYRLRQASGSGNFLPDLFSFWGFLAIWWLTRGYPRKIVMLCSKTLISLIIQNGSTVGARLVFACSKRVASAAGGRGVRWIALAGLPVLAAVLAGAWYLSHPRQPRPPMAAVEIVPSPLPPPAPAAPLLPASPPVSVSPPPPIPSRPESAAATAVVPEAPPAAAPQALAPPPAAEEVQIVETAPPVAAIRELGNLRLERGETLSKMIARVYGRFTTASLQLVLDHNPTITNGDNLPTGTIVTFPVESGPQPQPADGRFRIRFAEFPSLDQAYQFLRRIPEAEAAQLRILALLSPAGELGFQVIHEESFGSELLARKRLAQLEQWLADTAVVFQQWAEGTLLLAPQ
ncbi:MAG: AAA family ATPase [Thermodesulfobacteriota bacterium]